MENLLGYDVFLDIIGYLSQETDYIAWYPMFKIFEYLSTYLPFQENHFLKVINDEFSKWNSYVALLHRCLLWDAVYAIDGQVMFIKM
jgi:hypothetical protein